jgi:hypothetical protein
MEGLGLLHIQPSISQDTVKNAPEDSTPNRWLRGCRKNLPGGSVEDFLARCRADKERELTMERHREEERAKLSS